MRLSEQARRKKYGLFPSKIYTIFRKRLYPSQLTVFELFSAINQTTSISLAGAKASEK